MKKEAAEFHSARTPLKETRRNFNEPRWWILPAFLRAPLGCKPSALVNELRTLKWLARRESNPGDLINSQA